MRLGRSSRINRTEFVRLLQQSLRKLGYEDAARQLENESVGGGVAGGWRLGGQWVAGPWVMGRWVTGWWVAGRWVAGRWMGAGLLGSGWLGLWMAGRWVADERGRWVDGGRLLD
jgi:hypothetical protein